jgi:hypothetical protein
VILPPRGETVDAVEYLLFERYLAGLDQVKSMAAGR